MTPKFLIRREKCPICHSKDFKTVYRRSFSKDPIKTFLKTRYPKIDDNLLEDLGYFELGECASCKGIFHRNILKDFYNNEIIYSGFQDSKQELLNKQFRKMKRNRWLLQLETFQELYQIASYFKKDADKIYTLDFGCGWGYWAMMASSFGCNSYGIEIDEIKARYAEERGIKIRRIESLKERFDFINSNAVFEHLENPLITLNKLSNFLKDGGIIRISVPNGKRIKAKLKKEDNWKQFNKAARNSLNPVWPFGHRNCFTHESLIKMAKSCHLEQFKMPLGTLISSSFVKFGNPKKALKSFFRPFLLNLLNDRTDLFFIKKI